MAITYDIDNLGQALYAKLNTVTALGGRIYPQRIPEGDVWPSASYYIISAVPEEVKSEGAVIDEVRVQVSIFGATYAAVAVIADAVRVALVATTGETNSTTIDTIRLVDETDIYEDDIKIYHRAQDYMVRIKNLTLGAELIIGGSLTSSTGWDIIGVAGGISGGVFKLSSGTGTSSIRQTVGILTTGYIYYITLDMSAYEGGTVAVTCGTAVEYLSANKTHTFIITAAGISPVFEITLTNTSATIDNVSVKQIL